MKVLVTGSSGFIGFNLSKALLDLGMEVIGIDSLNEYYDITLKMDRQKQLENHENFKIFNNKVEDIKATRRIFDAHEPNMVIHLAAQAGVRYSIEHPREYVDSNVIGSFNILECCKDFDTKHLLMASTSSIYGANTNTPYSEVERADHQLTIYSATKKSMESMAHAYSSLWKIPITIFRFFTVYGPWGRPDMAFFKFTKGIIDGTPIDLYNNGQMRRDFTFVDDIAKAIHLLMEKPPEEPNSRSQSFQSDSISPTAPYRVVNIGNAFPIELLDFISALETAIGKKAIRINKEMQPGDVIETHADTELLKSLTGFTPTTDLSYGVQQFVDWYKEYYSEK